MTPNADRDNPASIPLNQETFLMSNMVPQAPNNNQGPWADLENFLRTLLPTNEVYSLLVLRVSVVRATMVRRIDRERPCHGSGLHVEGRVVVPRATTMSRA